MHRFNTLTLQFSFNQKIKIRCINANKNIGVSALKAQNSDIQIEGMAGERMLEAGCVQLWDKNLPRARKNFF
jgi:hypothetical protein